MSPRIEVVQRIEDEAEALEPRDVELAILDVVVVRNNADVGIELASRLFRNLSRRQRKAFHLFEEVASAVPVLWTS